MLPLKKLGFQCLIVVLTIVSAHSAPAFPVPDKISANRLASEFCRKIGQVATVPAANLDTSRLALNKAASLNTRWQVEFPSQAVIEVDGASGNITHYMNSAFFHRKSEQLENEAMTKEQAIQRAINVLKATGVSVSELSLLEAKEASSFGNANPEQGSVGQWNVTWNRVYHGIPYYQDNAIVELQGASGEVIGLGVNFHSQPVSASLNKITQVKAVLIAQQQLAAAELDLPLKGAVALIVQPNSFWRNGNERPSVDISRPAWFCSFGQGEQFYAVWVDMQTEDVIGGTMGGTLGSGPVKRQAPVFGHQLKHSNWKTKLK